MQYSVETRPDSISAKAYNEFLSKNQESSYFHTLQYFLTLKQTKGVKAVFLVVKDTNDVIVASALGELANELKYLPYFSRRLLFYDKPLSANSQALDFLLNHLKQIKAGLFIQIRSFFPFSEQELSTYKKSGFLLSDHLNAFIPLKGQNESAIFSQLKKDKRKGIKRATERYMLNVTEFQDKKKAVDIFYSMQKKLFKKKRHALKTKAFFLNLINSSDGSVSIAFAIFEGIPIASQLYISYNKKITALYTATLEEHKDKYAGDFLIWHLIKKGLHEGFEIFDFGGGGNPNNSYSPRLYKERFGTQFTNIGRLNLPKSPLYKIIMKIYQKTVKR